MRFRLAALFVIVVLGALVPQVEAQAPETAVVVTTEAAYRSALTTLAADNSGAHTITLGESIKITGATDPSYVGTQPLTIAGNGFDLSGGNTRRVLSGGAGGGLLTMTDIQVIDAFSSGSGGAVNWTGPARFERVEAAGNASAGSGGAVVVEGDIQIIDSEFSGNTVNSATIGQGGAVQASPGIWTITATRSVFRNNVVDAEGNGSGGALRSNGDINLTDVLFRGNRVDSGAGASGGAVATGRVVTLTRGLLEDHVVNGVVAANGGAISALGGGTLVDVTVIGNTATADDFARGSAVYGPGGLDLSNVTVAGNTASAAAATGAVNTSGDLQGEHATIVDNGGVTAANVVAGDLDVDGFVIGRPVLGPNCTLTGQATTTASVDDDGTCELSVTGANASDVADIGLGPLRPNGDLLTHPDLPVSEAPSLFPLAGSPLVDRVTTVGCLLAADIRGVPRPFGGGCDAGAVEAVYPAHAFTDVSAWVEDAVRWMAHGELMTGITPTTFVPNDPITRAQVVRVLYREAGSPDVSGYPAHGFTDVPPWVEDAVRWAKGEGIATGITPTTFVPNDPITRAEVVRMKYRFAGSPPVAVLPAHPFTDVPAWVQDAVRWAANTNNPLPLATGITPTLFKPNDSITRAQVARMDYRLAITPAAWADPDQAPDTMPFRPS